jgi:hypothetical protein
LVINLLAIVLVLTALCVCPAAGAKVIFGEAPDPSLAYPANRQLPKDNEAADANPATESARQAIQSQSSASPTETPSPSESTIQTKSRPVPEVQPQPDVHWITWHARIDKEIAERFTPISSTFRGVTAAHVVIKYYVAKDRQIRNASFDQESSNVLFNIAAKTVVNSLNNDPILQFPDGYDGCDVQMQAEFSAPSMYQYWHDEREREIRHIGDFKYVW